MTRLATSTGLQQARSRRRGRGFGRRGITLIELLVVIGIIGIIASIAVVFFVGAGDAAKESATRSEVELIGAAIDGYHRRFGRWPHPDSNKSISQASVADPGTGNFVQIQSLTTDRYEQFFLFLSSELALRNSKTAPMIPDSDANEHSRRHSEVGGAGNFRVFVDAWEHRIEYGVNSYNVVTTQGTQNRRHVFVRSYGKDGQPDPLTGANPREPDYPGDDLEWNAPGTYEE